MTDRIDPKRIEEWKRAWNRLGDPELPVVDFIHGVQGVLPALPALLSERESLLSLLREVEWNGGEGAHVCPACRAYAGLEHNPVNGEHAPDCRLAAFLKET